MKPSPSRSRENLMSVEGCSLKLRFLTLVINTADFINERASPTLGYSHAVLGPSAIFLTFIFLGIMVISSIKKSYPSRFIEIYGLVACTIVESSLSITVFKELKKIGNVPMNYKAALILDGVLPMLIVFLLIGDLIVLLFSYREELASPNVLPTDSHQTPVESH